MKISVRIYYSIMDRFTHIEQEPVVACTMVPNPPKALNKLRKQ